MQQKLCNFYPIYQKKRNWPLNYGLTMFLSQFLILIILFVTSKPVPLFLKSREICFFRTKLLIKKRQSFIATVYYIPYIKLRYSLSRKKLINQIGLILNSTVQTILCGQRSAGAFPTGLPDGRIMLVNPLKRPDRMDT